MSRALSYYYAYNLNGLIVNDRFVFLREATTTLGVLGEDFVSYSYRRQIL